MIMFFLGLVVGLGVGFIFGCVAMAMLASAGRDDESVPERRQWSGGANDRF